LPCWEEGGHSNEIVGSFNFTKYNTFFVMKGNSSGNPRLDEPAADDVRYALTHDCLNDVVGEAIKVDRLPIMNHDGRRRRYASGTNCSRRRSAGRRTHQCFDACGRR
jgi:hypothetical protein